VLALGNKQYDDGRLHGWYTARVGAWRLIAFNSNCGFVPYAAGSRQWTWLLGGLNRKPAPCTVAIMHHPADVVRSSR